MSTISAFDVFVVGKCYRVLRPFLRGTRVVVGEILRFDSWYFSRYDEAYLYYFERIARGDIATWMLYPDELPSSWRDYFGEEESPR